MQDMTPSAPLVPERQRSEEELLLDRIAEIAMRAWFSAKGKQPLTHRTLQSMCAYVHQSMAQTEANQRTALGLYDGIDADTVRPRRAHLFKCHNALWRRVTAHEATRRVPKMKPDAYVCNPKKLPSVTDLSMDHGALYALFRQAAKASGS